MEASLQLERSVFPEDTIEKNVIGMASIDAKLDESPEMDRKPVHIVGVIDISTSMSDGKLALVKASLSFIIDQLSSQDTLGLVQFGNTATKVLSLTKMTNDGKIYAKTKIDRMRPIGSTNLSAGLLMGLNLINEDITTLNLNNEDTEEAKRYTLMLFTDGEANMGIYEPTELRKALISYIGVHAERVQILGFGFGQEHNVEMIQDICLLTPSSEYYYIQDRESIGPQFAECLGGMLSLVAQNVKLTILRDDDHYDIIKIWKSLTENSLPSDEDGFVVNIGDLYREQRKDIIFTFRTNQSSITLKAMVSYYDVLNETTTTQDLRLEVSFTEGSDAIINWDVRKNYHRVLVAECMKNAIMLAETDLTAAKQSIRNCITFLKGETGGEEMTLMLIEDLEACLRGMTDYNEYFTIGKSCLHTYSSSHANQRSSHYTTAYQDGLVSELMHSEAYLNASNAIPEDIEELSTPSSARSRNLSASYAPRTRII